MNTHRLKRPLSALSAATLLAAWWRPRCPCVPNHLSLRGPTATQVGSEADSQPGPDGFARRGGCGSEAITDPVLQVGADSTAQPLVDE